MKEFFQFKGKQKVNIWKVISVIFIILFVLALIGGLFRIYHFRASFTTPTQDQIDSAKAIVAQELRNKGDDINNYEIVVPKNIRKFDGRMPPPPINIFGRMESPRSIIQLSLSNNSVRHSYLIDMDSGEVLIHSQIEYLV